MAAGKRKKKSKILPQVALVCFVVYALISLVKLQMDVSARRQELESLQTQAEEQRLANKDSERALSAENDDEYYARIARERLNYGYPNERVIVDASGN